MQLILNGDTRPILFFMASASDHVAGFTGGSPAVTLSKNGGAFAAPAGAVSEVGGGWYKLTPSGTDTATNGMLVLHAAASGADPADVAAQVVAFSPYDSIRLGLTALPGAAAGASGGLPLADLAGDVTLDSASAASLVAAIASAILATPGNKLATDPAGAVTATGVGGPSAASLAAAVWDAPGAAHAGAGSFGALLSGLSGAGSGLTAASLLDASLAGHGAAGTVGGALTTLVGALAESYAANGQPATLAQLLYGVFALLANVSQSGATISANRLDGVTPAMSFTLDSATAPTARRRAA